jgi:secondary thiamine-phosphate synthase enzyme
MVTVAVKTKHRRELIDVTAHLRQAVAETGLADGLVVAFVPHTTAGVTINENADPDVRRDLLSHFAALVPERGDFRHDEGNSDAHIQATLVGSSVTVIVSGGRLQLGTWQSVFFCEFDGPRSRSLYIEAVKK